MVCGKARPGLAAACGGNILSQRYSANWKHFARTRGRFFSLSVRRHLGWWKGFAMGLLAGVVVTLIDAAIVTAFDYAAGLPID